MSTLTGILIAGIGGFIIGFLPIPLWLAIPLAGLWGYGSVLVCKNLLED